MRVALIATSLRLAGAEKQFAYTARAFLEAGLEPSVFYLGAPDHYQRVLQAAGVPVTPICRPRRPWAVLLRLVAALRKLKPHLVLASQFGDLAYAAPAGRACHALVLGGVRSNGFYELNTAGKRKWLLLRGTHGLVANSHRARANLIGEGVSSEKIAVLPNVIDLDEFDSMATLPLRHPLPANRPIIAAVGSLHPGKRFDRFIDAVALARRSAPEIFAVIAGADLGARAALEHRARAASLGSEDLAFLGEYDRVPALLKQCRLLALTSDFEGFPNVLLEAMAAGIPVLTTPVGDAVRIVEHGGTGYVLQFDDVRRMALAMVELAANHKLAARMGARARDCARQHYNQTGLSRKWLSLVHEFAAQRQHDVLLEALRSPAPPPARAAAPMALAHSAAAAA